MSGQIRDIYTPAERVEVTGGAHGLRTASGLDMVAQRIVRLLWMTPGELLHRPTIGGGLGSYSGKMPTPDMLKRLNLSIEALLDTLRYIEGYTVKINRVDGSLTTIDIVVNVSGQRLSLPTIKIT